MKDSYLALFQKCGDSLPGGKQVREFRNQAFEVLKTLSVPTVKGEDWRYTSLNDYGKQDFLPLPRKTNPPFPANSETPPVPESDCHRIVFMNGVFDPNSSQFPSNGIEMGSVRELSDKPELLPEFLSLPPEQKENFFALLNAVFFEDGIFLRLKEGLKSEKPIHVVYLTNPETAQTSLHPRNVIIAGRNSKLTLIEQYLGFSDSSCFMNPSTNFFLDEDAEVEHCCILEEGTNTLHVGDVFVSQRARSRFLSNTFQLRGKLTRREMYLDLGEDTESAANGLYIGADEEHRDFFVRMNHRKPGGKSRQLFKGILRDKSHGVFNGKIIVWEDAQKTDAHQTNKSLLLSDEAVSDTRPQLEIYSDDVKCTHGATVGQLDEDALFYLKSRGISDDEAKRILTSAFASENIQAVALEPVRSYLEKQLFQ